MIMLSHWQAEPVEFRTMKPSITEKGNVENMICSKILSDKDLMSMGDRDLITSLSNPKHLDKLQGFMALEGNILAQTAVQVLIRKRDKLVKLFPFSFPFSFFLFFFLFFLSPLFTHSMTQ